MTDQLGHSTSYAYDADGNQTSVTNRDGLTITKTYDSLGNPLTETWYAADGKTVVRSKTFAYDADGNLTSASDSTGGYTFAYDADGRLTKQTDPNGITLTLAYDGDGNVTSVTDSLGGTVTSTYDAAGDLASRGFSGPNGQALLAQLTYDDAGLLTGVSRFSDLAGQNQVGTSSLGYDAQDRLTSLTHKAGSTTLASYTYSYDAGARLTSETDNGSTTNYTYDATNQLLTAGSQNYAYDANGNPKGTQAVVNNQPSTDGTWNYGYDNEGNLVSQVGVSNGLSWAFAYDDANELTSVTETQGSTVLVQASYTYDVLGHRLQSSVSLNGGAAVVTNYAYSGDTLWADLSGGALQMRYIAGDQPDQWLARVDAGGTVGWFLTDHLGSVRDIMSNAGGVVDHLDYDAFGKIVNETQPSAGGRLKYAGYEQDAGTGFYYDKARYYDAVYHRFVTQDPSGLGPDSNPYRYVHNGPTNAIDPSGMEASPPPTIKQMQEQVNILQERRRLIFGQISQFQTRMDEAQRRVPDQLPPGLYGRISKDDLRKSRQEEYASAKAKQDALLKKVNELQVRIKKLKAAIAGVQNITIDKYKEMQGEQLQIGNYLERRLGPSIASLSKRIEADNQSGKDVRADQALLAKKEEEWAELTARWDVLDYVLSQRLDLRDLLWEEGVQRARAGAQADWEITSSYAEANRARLKQEREELRQWAVKTAGALTPVLGEMMALGEAAFGEDIFGNKLGTKERWIAAGAGGLPVVGRVVGKAVTRLVKTSEGAAAARELKAAWQEVQAARTVEATSTAVAKFQAAAKKATRELTVLNACFVAGTPLLTPGGAKAIELFRPGDLILSRSEFDPDGPVAAKQVEDVFVRVALVWSVRVKGREIRTTGEHPFYVVGKGWVKAAFLHAGDLVIGPDGRQTAVEGSAETRSVETVYNVRVADYHTYFVGCQEWGFSVWAHNFNCGDLADLLGLPRGEARVMKAWDYLTKNAKPSQAELERILTEGGHTLPRSTKANGLLSQSDRLKQAIAKTQEVRELGPLFAKADPFAKIKVPEGAPFTGSIPKEVVNSLPPWVEGTQESVYGVLVVDGKAYYLRSGIDPRTEILAGRTYHVGLAKDTPWDFPSATSKYGLRDHVEAGAGVIMRNLEATEATLYLNKLPCGSLTETQGCWNNLRYMIPENSKIRVYYPSQKDKNHILSQVIPGAKQR